MFILSFIVLLDMLLGEKKTNTAEKRQDRDKHEKNNNEISGEGLLNARKSTKLRRRGTGRRGTSVRRNVI